VTELAGLGRIVPATAHGDAGSPSGPANQRPAKESAWRRRVGRMPAARRGEFRPEGGDLASDLNPRPPRPPPKPPLWR
jgi:hypothetical protein